MTRTFSCPSCGAPLEPQGSASTVTCSFCSASVVVPADLRAPDLPGGFSFTAVSINGDQVVVQSGSSIPPEQMMEISRLIRAGNKIAAIKLYREQTGQGLKESKDAVDMLEKLLAQTGARSPGEVAAVFNQVSGALPVMFATPAAPAAAKHSRWLVWLFVLIVLAVALPILLTTVITTGVTSAVSRGMDAVATQEFSLPTAPGPRPTSTFVPSPTPGFAALLLDFGSEGIGPGQFTDTRLVAEGADGRIYAAEYTGGRLQIFDRGGQYLDQIALNPELPVLGLAVDRKGTIFVSQGGEILTFSAETFQSTGKISPPRGKFYQNFALTPTGKLAVALVSAQSPDDIAIIDATGTIERAIPAAFASQTNSPELDMTLAVDGLGNLYALGSFNSMVLKYSSEGKFITRFGSRGNEPGQFRSVQGLAVDGQGRVYVSSASEIQAFDGSGRYLGSIDLQGTVYFGVNVTARDELLVAARYRVLKFKPGQ